MIQTSVQKAASILGSQANLAREVGASPAMVHQWINGIRPISAERCIDIDRATNGAVSCEELRPDLIDRWSYLRGTNSAVATNNCDPTNCSACSHAETCERRTGITEPCELLRKKRKDDNQQEAA